MKLSKKDFIYMRDKIGIMRIYKAKEVIEEEFRDIDTLQGLRVKYNWGSTGVQMFEYNTPYDDILKMEIFINRLEMEKHHCGCLYCAIQHNIFEVEQFHDAGWNVFHIMKYIYKKGIYYEYNDNFEAITCKVPEISKTYREILSGQNADLIAGTPYESTGPEYKVVTEFILTEDVQTFPEQTLIKDLLSKPL